MPPNLSVDADRHRRASAPPGGLLSSFARPHEMRNALLVATVATAILASLTGCAHQVTASSDVQPEERRVLAAEDEYIAAEVSRDEATLRKLIDDRFVFNSSRGTTSDKEELVQRILKMNMRRLGEEFHIIAPDARGSAMTTHSGGPVSMSMPTVC